jgi:hypothetical protein
MMLSPASWLQHAFAPWLQHALLMHECIQLHRTYCVQSGLVSAQPTFHLPMSSSSCCMFMRSILSMCEKRHMPKGPNRQTPAITLCTDCTNPSPFSWCRKKGSSADVPFPMRQWSNWSGCCSLDYTIAGMSSAELMVAKLQQRAR